MKLATVIDEEELVEMFIDSRRGKLYDEEALMMLAETEIVPSSKLRSATSCNGILISEDVQPPELAVRSHFDETPCGVGICFEHDHKSRFWKIGEVVQISSEDCTNDFKNEFIILQPGDRVLEVDSNDVTGLDPPAFGNCIMGPEGTQAVLTIERANRPLRHARDGTQVISDRAADCQSEKLLIKLIRTRHATSIIHPKSISGAGISTIIDLLSGRLKLPID